MKRTLFLLKYTFLQVLEHFTRRQSFFSLLPLKTHARAHVIFASLLYARFQKKKKKKEGWRKRKKKGSLQSIEQVRSLNLMASLIRSQMLPGDYPASTSTPRSDDSFDMYNLIGKRIWFSTLTRSSHQPMCGCLEANRPVGSG